MHLAKTTIVRKEATLDDSEFVRFRAGPRTTMIITRARLDMIMGREPGTISWEFTVFGYREERAASGWDPGRAADRQLTYSSVSGASVPVELKHLFQWLSYQPEKTPR